MDKEGPKKSETSLINENYANTFDEDEEQYEDETELEPVDYKESETTELYKNNHYIPFQKRQTKQFLEPPFSVYIKEHTTSDSAEEYKQEECSYSDAVSFDVVPKHIEKGLYPVYPSTSRPYDIQYSLNKTRALPELLPNRVQQAKTHLEFVVSEPEVNVYDTRYPESSTEDLEGKKLLKFSSAIESTSIKDTSVTVDETGTQTSDKEEARKDTASKSEEGVKHLPSWGFGETKAPGKSEPTYGTSETDVYDDGWRFGREHSPTKRHRLLSSQEKEEMTSTSRAPSRLLQVENGASRGPSRLSEYDDVEFDSLERSGRRSRSRARDDSRIGLLSEAFDNVSLQFREALDAHRALKIRLYKNGDPWFGGVNYVFIPGKIITSLDTLFRDVAPKLDLDNGVSYIFDLDGNRLTSIDEIEDGGGYVCSSTRKFIMENYGGTGDAFMNAGLSRAPSRNNSRMLRHPVDERKISTAFSYERKIRSSISDPDRDRDNIGTGGNHDKPGSGDGRIIQIINFDNQNIKERVLLNMKTSQSFDDVLVDLGQVLKIKYATHMYTKKGKEVRSFSHLRNLYAKEESFIISDSPQISSSFSEEDSSDQPKRVTNGQYDTEDAEVDDYVYRNKLKPVRGLTSRRNSDDDLLNKGTLWSPTPKRKSKTRNSKSNDVEFGDSEPIKVTIKGERKVFYPPSTGYRKILDAPSNKLVVDWVYGYRGYDTNKNLWLLDNNDLVYFVGTFGIVYDRMGETQKHYLGHSEEIQCMDVHPTRHLAVSGQRSGKTPDTRAHIRVWDVDNLETLSVLGFGEYELGVLGVAFSSHNQNDELLVVGVDKAPEEAMSVWEVESDDYNRKGAKGAKLLGRVATNQEVLHGVSFHPLDDHLVITFGKNHLTFWNRRKDGFFERSDMIEDGRTVTCLTFLESGDLVAGDDTGCVRIYSVTDEGEYYVSQEIDKAHTDTNNPKLNGVGSVLVQQDGSLHETLVTGGVRDRKVITWDILTDFTKLKEVTLPEGLGSIRTLANPAQNDRTLYIGTTRNCILEGSMTKKFNLVLWGHSQRLDAIAVHPDDFSFVTAGHDKFVVKWRKQKVIWKVSVQTECVSVAYHPNGVAIAAGTLDGHAVILNAENGSHITTLRVCGAPINALAYNRAGDVLGLGKLKYLPEFSNIRLFS